jgi:hypothetical protein
MSGTSDKFPIVCDMPVKALHYWTKHTQVLNQPAGLLRRDPEELAKQKASPTDRSEGDVGARLDQERW